MTLQHTFFANLPENNFGEREKALQTQILQESSKLEQLGHRVLRAEVITRSNNKASITIIYEKQ
jgi:hypothetical protein